MLQKTLQCLLAQNIDILGRSGWPPSYCIGSDAQVEVVHQVLGKEGQEPLIGDKSG